MEVIPKTMQSIREEMRKGRGEHLTVSQFRVLAAVNRGLCHNKEIGDILGVSEAAISRMVDVLVQDGLVKKDINKLDRRVKSLSLTIAGQKFFNHVEIEAKARLKQKLHILSKTEMDTVAKGLEILRTKLPYI